MKAKLIKIKDGYKLLTQGFLKGSTNHGLIESLNIEEGPIRYKLSPKNCQAIERGWDLDELISESDTSHLALFTSDSHELMYDEGFKAGFQKALEILGDKKFSEEDMGKAWSEGYHRKVDELNGNGLRYFDKFIQSLQQTEWEVEIEMDEEKEFIFDPAMGISQGHYLDKPKLDENNCLILKRIWKEN